jgi:hypothetical protein
VDLARVARKWADRVWAVVAKSAWALECSAVLECVDPARAARKWDDPAWVVEAWAARDRWGRVAECAAALGWVAQEWVDPA